MIAKFEIDIEVPYLNDSSWKVCDNGEVVLEKKAKKGDLMELTSEADTNGHDVVVLKNSTVPIKL